MTNKPKLEITIEKLEGIIEYENEKEINLSETVNSFELANSYLYLHSKKHNAPPRGHGYLKTNIKITLDELAYEFRYDMVLGGMECHEDREYPNLYENFKSRLLFYAGLLCPSHWDNSEYFNYLESYGKELKTHAKKILKKLSFCQR